jgi:hypothetical protein
VLSLRRLQDTQRQGQQLTHSQVHYVTRASKFRCHYFNTRIVHISEMWAVNTEEYSISL